MNYQADIALVRLEDNDLIVEVTAKEPADQTIRAIVAELQRQLKL